MEQQPDRDPTPWLSLTEGSSTSTTMPMMLRDMSLRSSMMALLPSLLSLLDTVLLDMALWDTVLWDMVWLANCLNQLKGNRQKTSPIKLSPKQITSISSPKLVSYYNNTRHDHKGLYLFVNYIYECYIYKFYDKYISR